MAIALLLTAAHIVGIWILAAAVLAVRHWIRGRRAEPLQTPGVAIVIVAVVVCTAYLANSRRLVHLDSQPAVFSAVSLLYSGDFTLNEFRPAIDPILVQCITTPDGRVYSMYPAGSALALIPFLAPTRLLGVSLSLVVLDATVKLAAAVWTALSAALLLAALRSYAPHGALLATLAYALGTTAFSAASQDLWQHGPSQAGLALALFVLAKPRQAPHHEILLGVALGWAVVCRTSNLLPVLVLLAATGVRGWRAVLRTGFGAAPFALFTAIYNHMTTGSPLLFAHSAHHGGEGFGQGLVGGLLALLFEPSRGAFVYSPFLVLALAGIAVEGCRLVGRRQEAARDEHDDGRAPLALLGGVAAVPLLLLVAQWEEWHGGWSYGYRIISEVGLLLTPGFALLIARWRPRQGRLTLATGLVALSVAIHALHVFFPENGWNAAHLVGTSYRGMWSSDVRDWQISWHLRGALEQIRGRSPERASRLAPNVTRLTANMTLAGDAECPVNQGADHVATNLQIP